MKKRTEGTDHKKSKSLINRCFLTGGDSRRLLSIGVSALLFVSTFLASIPQMSVPVYADGTGKKLQLGASALAPVMTSVKEEGYDPDEKNRVTTAQTVYYGSSGSQEWYVIGANGTGAVRMPDTVTLFAEDNLETDLRYDTGSNQYNGSYIKRVVDGYYNHVLFTGDEKAHIAERSLDPGDYSSDPGSFCDGISDTNPVNAFLWLLSTKEADLVGRSYRTANVYWWLRSPGRLVTDAANVGKYGNVNYSGFGVYNNDDPNVGVRPAFNINLSSIILTSAAEGGKSSGTTGAGALTAPTSYDGSQGWKLTVNDTSRSGFTVTRLGSGEIAAGGNMRFNYSGAKKADNEYVSAILLDGSDSLLAYGRIVNTSSSTSGTSYITLPSTLVTNGNTYTLQFISEQYHTDKSTDYSSSPSSNSIAFTAGKGTPTAVDFNVELPTDTTYDGSQKSATVTAETGVSGMGNITVKYKDADNNVSTSAPTDPGTYQILLNVAEGTYYDAADNITDDGWTFTISTAGTVATPTFSPTAGTYATAQNVEISCSTTGATIHYTTDGTTPTSSSPTYRSAINVDGNMTIRAIAVKSGMTNSEIAEATYTISPSSTDHNITVENDGHGTGTATPYSASNDALIMLSATADDNYVFDRWTTEDNIRIINPGSSSDAYFRMIDEDVTVKANFKPETPTEKCTVTFDKNGGKGDMDDQTVDKGVRTQLNKNKFTRSGYSFDGWNTDPDGDGTGYEDKDYISVQKNITLYAQWERDDHEDDDDDDDEDEVDHTPASWILNPNEKQQLSIIFTGTPEGTCAGYQEQGAAAKAVFAAATPRGWSEAFEFNLLNKNRQPEMTLKKGTITLTIPSEYRKAGRQFALIALTKGGQTILLPDTDTNPNTVTATINVEGYAFSLIYKD